MSDDDLKRLRRCRRLFSVVFLASVFGTEVWLLSQGNETVIDHFFRYLFATVYQMALMGVRLPFASSREERGLTSILRCRRSSI